MAKMPGRLTAKFKNAESFYIKQSYLDANGKSTSRTIRKLGTLNQLLIEHGPTRDDVIIYYQMGLNRVCRKIHDRHHYGYDLNAILSDLIYTRILEPGSKRSSFMAAQNFLEPPGYQLHDVYRALSVLAEESDRIQSEVYKNISSLIKRNDHILYYDCTSYYFESSALRR